MSGVAAVSPGLQVADDPRPRRWPESDRPVTNRRPQGEPSLRSVGRRSRCWLCRRPGGGRGRAGRPRGM